MIYYLDEVGRGIERECEAAAEAKRINRIEKKTIMYFILDKRKKKMIIIKERIIKQYKKRRLIK